MALNACMRRQRTRMSCSVKPSAWPMWSEPVTLGGGSAMLYGALGAVSSAWKKSCDSQKRSQRGSTSLASYCFDKVVLDIPDTDAGPERKLTRLGGQLGQVLADDRLGQLRHHLPHHLLDDLAGELEE